MDSSIIRDIQNAYQQVYFPDENIFEDIVNFCDANNIFETLEETEYFANLIIENDLALTFVEDALEYYAEEQLLDESYIAEVSAGLIAKGLKAAGGLLKATPKALKGLPAKTLVKRGYQPGGLKKTGELLGKTNKPALATQTRAIQQARAARKPPEAPKANKYADMLAQKKAATPAPSAPKPSTSKAGGMTPSYVAKRGVTDTLATTLALGMGHMAGIKPATNVLRQMTTPIVRTAGKVLERTPPTASRAVTAAAKAAPKAPKGAASDPWMQFPKTSGKPKQLGLPKEGPSSRLPNRTLPGSPTPKALPAAGKTSAPKTGLSPEGQAIQRLNKMTGGGALGTRELPKTAPRAPKPAWGPDASPKPTKTPGTVQRSVLPAESKPSTVGKKPSGTRPTPSTGGKTGSGLTHTVRATLSPTEKTGNMKYPGLEKYATGSGPGTGGAKPPKKSATGRIAAAAGAAATAAAVADSERQQRKQQKETEKQQKGLVSNIEKPKKKVTGEDVRKSFDTAFATERKLKGSKGTFRWTNPLTGKSGTYTTQMASEESVDNFDFVLDALLTEGYTNEEALEIMANLDEGLISKLASGAIKGVIKAVGPKLTKTKLPPEISPQKKAIKLAMKQLGIKPEHLMGSPQARNAAVARAAELRRNPPVKPKPRNPFPDDVYSKDSLGGIRGYRSGD